MTPPRKPPPKPPPNAKQPPPPPPPPQNQASPSSSAPPSSMTDPAVESTPPLFGTFPDVASTQASSTMAQPPASSTMAQPPKLPQNSNPANAKRGPPSPAVASALPASEKNLNPKETVSSSNPRNSSNLTMAPPPSLNVSRPPHEHRNSSQPPVARTSSSQSSSWSAVAVPNSNKNHNNKFVTVDRKQNNRKYNKSMGAKSQHHHHRGRREHHQNRPRRVHNPQHHQQRSSNHQQPNWTMADRDWRQHGRSQQNQTNYRHPPARSQYARASSSQSRSTSQSADRVNDARASSSQSRSTSQSAVAAPKHNNKIKSTGKHASSNSTSRSADRVKQGTDTSHPSRPIDAAAAIQPTRPPTRPLPPVHPLLRDRWSPPPVVSSNASPMIQELAHALLNGTPNLQVSPSDQATENLAETILESQDNAEDNTLIKATVEAGSTASQHDSKTDSLDPSKDASTLDPSETASLDRTKPVSANMKSLQSRHGGLHRFINESPARDNRSRPPLQNSPSPTKDSAIVTTPTCLPVDRSKLPNKSPFVTTPRPHSRPASTNNPASFSMNGLQTITNSNRLTSSAVNQSPAPANQSRLPQPSFMDQQRRPPLSPSPTKDSPVVTTPTRLPVEKPKSPDTSPFEARAAPLPDSSSRSSPQQGTDTTINGASKPDAKPPSRSRNLLSNVATTVTGALQAATPNLVGQRLLASDPASPTIQNPTNSGSTLNSLQSRRGHLHRFINTVRASSRPAQPAAVSTTLGRQPTATSGNVDGTTTTISQLDLPVPQLGLLEPSTPPRVSRIGSFSPCPFDSDFPGISGLPHPPPPPPTNILDNPAALFDLFNRPSSEQSTISSDSVRDVDSVRDTTVDGNSMHGGNNTTSHLLGGFSFEEGADVSINTFDLLPSSTLGSSMNDSTVDMSASGTILESQDDAEAESSKPVSTAQVGSFAPTRRSRRRRRQKRRGPKGKINLDHIKSVTPAEAILAETEAFFAKKTKNDAPTKVAPPTQGPLQLPSQNNTVPDSAAAKPATTATHLVGDETLLIVGDTLSDTDAVTKIGEETMWIVRDEMTEQEWPVQQHDAVAVNRSGPGLGLDPSSEQSMDTAGYLERFFSTLDGSTDTLEPLGENVGGNNTTMRLLHGSTDTLELLRENVGGWSNFGSWISFGNLPGNLSFASGANHTMNDTSMDMSALFPTDFDASQNGRRRQRVERSQNVQDEEDLETSPSPTKRRRASEPTAHPRNNPPSPPTLNRRSPEPSPPVRDELQEALERFLQSREPQSEPRIPPPRTSRLLNPREFDFSIFDSPPRARTRGRNRWTSRSIRPGDLDFSILHRWNLELSARPTAGTLKAAPAATAPATLKAAPAPAQPTTPATRTTVVEDKEDGDDLEDAESGDALPTAAAAAAPTTRESGDRDSLNDSANLHVSATSTEEQHERSSSLEFSSFTSNDEQSESLVNSKSLTPNQLSPPVRDELQQNESSSSSNLDFNSFNSNDDPLVGSDIPLMPESPVGNLDESIDFEKTPARALVEGSNPRISDVSGITHVSDITHDNHKTDDETLEHDKTSSMDNEDVGEKPTADDKDKGQETSNDTNASAAKPTAKPGYLGPGGKNPRKRQASPSPALQQRPVVPLLGLEENEGGPPDDNNNSRSEHIDGATSGVAGRLGGTAFASWDADDSEQTVNPPKRRRLALTGQVQNLDGPPPARNPPQQPLNSDHLKKPSFVFRKLKSKHNFNPRKKDDSDSEDSDDDDNGTRMHGHKAKRPTDGASRRVKSHHKDSDDDGSDEDDSDDEGDTPKSGSNGAPKDCRVGKKRPDGDDDDDDSSDDDDTPKSGSNGAPKDCSVAKKRPDGDDDDDDSSDDEDTPKSRSGSNGNPKDCSDDDDEDASGSRAPKDGRNPLEDDDNEPMDGTKSNDEPMSLPDDSRAVSATMDDNSFARAIESALGSATDPLTDQNNKSSSDDLHDSDDLVTPGGGGDNQSSGSNSDTDAPASGSGSTNSDDADAPASGSGSTNSDDFGTPLGASGSFEVPATDDAGTEAISDDNNARASALGSEAEPSTQAPASGPSDDDRQLDSREWQAMKDEQSKTKELERIGAGGTPKPCFKERLSKLNDLHDKMKKELRERKRLRKGRDKGRGNGLPACCQAYARHEDLCRLLVPGVIVQIRWDAQQSKWLIGYYGATGDIMEYHLSDQCIQFLLMPRAYRLIQESIQQNPGGWKNVPVEYQYLFVRTLTFTKSRPRADGGVEMQDCSTSQAADINVSYDAQDKFCMNAEWQKAGDTVEALSKDLKEDIDKRREAQDPIFRLMKVGCAAPTEDVDLDFFQGKGNQRVELEFVQKRNAQTCIACTAASLVYLLGMTRKAKKLFGRLIKQLRLAQQASGSEYLTFSEEFVSKSVGIICSTLDCAQVALSDPEFDPLEHPTNHPVLVKLRTDNCQHVVAFYDGILIEPSLEHGLKITKKNLDWVCGGTTGDYKGIDWAFKLEIKKIDE
ncbi:expressed unknown protein [Seminavis robusta]|uniref:Uncharacterized protein n=1 Tax=Seminavis robusta TaxID=568900 RepID=A0A9N8H7X2_9STRA|nr:expressed unknown protein [Seminavis robusta]|eukprot:Sro197_g083710.1 n/a (2472) ;mRNA; r:6483-14504